MILLLCEFHIFLSFTDALEKKFSILVQQLKTNLTSIDHAFDNHEHDEKFDALEKKSGKTIFLIQQ